MSQVPTHPNRPSQGFSVIDKGIPRRSWIAYLAERQEVDMNNERQTGATDAQIEAAFWSFTRDQFPRERVPDDEINEWIGLGIESPTNRLMTMMDAAEYLVPPGQVITDAARVPTDDEIAAIDVIVSVAEGWSLFPAQTEVLRAYLERQR